MSQWEGFSLGAKIAAMLLVGWQLCLSKLMMWLFTRLWCLSLFHYANTSSYEEFDFNTALDQWLPQHTHTHFLLSHVNLSAHRNHFIKRPFDWNIEACTTLELCVWSSLKAHLNYAMHLVDWIDACSPMANARWLNSQLRTKKWATRACIRGLLHLIPMFSIVLLFICVFFLLLWRTILPMQMAVHTRVS